MSHFTRIRTRLRDLQTVKHALEDLGYEVLENEHVRGYAAQEVRADLVIRTPGSQYDIGFQRDGEQVVMVADLWGLRIDRQRFLDEVTQRYAYLTVLDQAQAQGWQVIAEEVQQDGSIRLVAQRWD